jgi:tetratricopeptide (TPR) repeat protein
MERALMSVRVRFSFVFHAVLHFFVFVSTVWPTTAQQATLGANAPLTILSSNGAPLEVYSESHALVIGINAYKGGETLWQPLQNAIAESQSVEAVLRDVHGFSVERHSDLNSQDLERVIKSFFGRHGAKPTARLLLWFAGHGYTVEGEGYLVPSDSEKPTGSLEEIYQFTQKAYPVRRFSEIIRTVKSKHVLLMFDSCFGGTIFNNTRSRSSDKPDSQFIVEKSLESSRYFISSGDAGEEVVEPSRFAKFFVEALKGLHPERLVTDRGYTTGSRIGAFLQSEVVNNRGKNDPAKHTPQHGAHAEFRIGDMIFKIPESKSLALPQTPSTVDMAAVQASCLKNPNIPRRIADCRTALEGDPNNTELLLKLAVANYFASHYEAALDGFERTLELDPRNIEARVWRAHWKRYRQDHAEAERELKAVIADHPNDVGALTAIAAVYEERNRDPEARWTRQNALSGIASDPRLQDKPLERALLAGELHRKLDQHDEAIQSYSLVLKSFGDNAKAYIGRGLAYSLKSNSVAIDEKRRLTALALADFDASLKFNPRDDDALFKRGELLCFAGGAQNISRGIADIEQAVRLNFRHPWALNALGECHAIKADYRSAVAAFERAIASKSEFADAYNGRGWGYANLKEGPDHQKAIKDFSEALRLNPGLGFAWANRGASYHALAWAATGAERDRYAALALADLSRGVEISSYQGRSYRFRGWFYERMKNNDALAFADYQKAVELEPSEAQNWFNRAAVHSRLGKVVEALSDYDVVLKIEPNRHEAVKRRAEIFENTARRTLAVTEMGRAIALAPTESSYWSYRCALWFRDNSNDEAFGDCNRAIELNQNDADAFHYRGHVQQKRKNQRDAIADFTRSLELAPGDLHITFERAGEYRNSREYSRAITDYASVTAGEPRNADAWYFRGFSHLRLSNHAQAIADLTQAISLEPQNDAAYYYRGLAKGATGDMRGKQADCREALRLDADDEDYKSCASSASPAQGNAAPKKR